MERELKPSHQDHDLTLEDQATYVGHRLPTLAATIEWMFKVAQRKYPEIRSSFRYLGFIRKLNQVDPKMGDEIRQLRQQFKTNYQTAVQIFGSEKKLRKFFGNDQPFFDWLL